MVNIKEWAKGITFFIFVTVMFYLLWNLIFLNIINFVGTDLIGLGSGASESYAILKTIAWISFVLIYLAIGIVYPIYTIINGAGESKETRPLEFLKALGVWCIIMPFTIIIFGIASLLTSGLPTITFESMQTLPNINCNQTNQEVINLSGTLVNSPAEISCTATSTNTGTFTNSEIVNGMSTYVWIITLIAILGLVALPFVFIIEGFGIKIY